MTQRKKLKQEEVTDQCECGGVYQLYMKDLISQFWFVSIFIYVIVHFIFQFAFILYESYIPGSIYPSPANDITMIMTFLIISIVLGIVFTLGIRKKLFTWQHHKSPKAFIRTFQVFLIVIIFFNISLIFNNSNVFYYNHVMIYSIVDKLSDLYPVFVLNVLFYLLLKKELEKNENSMVKQLFLGFIIIILPYFIWLTTLLFIQNFWIYMNYGIMPGFVYGMLFILGFIGLFKLLKQHVNKKKLLPIMIILAIAVHVGFTISIILNNLMPNDIISAIVILIILPTFSYIGLHVEFFQKGDETNMLGNMDKIDYSYYILLGFFFLSFFNGLEQLFVSTGVISNGLYLSNIFVSLFFLIGLIVGALITLGINRKLFSEKDN